MSFLVEPSPGRLWKSNDRSGPIALLFLLVTGCCGSSRLVADRESSSSEDSMPVVFETLLEHCSSFGSLLLSLRCASALFRPRLPEANRETETWGPPFAEGERRASFTDPQDVRTLRVPALSTTSKMHKFSAEQTGDKASHSSCPLAESNPGKNGFGGNTSTAQIKYGTTARGSR